MQRIHPDVRGRDDLAAELRDGPRIERAVGVGRRLRARIAADVDGAQQLRRRPARIVEIGLLPAHRQQPRVQLLDRHAAAGQILAVRRLGIPGVAFGRLPGIVADQPAGRAEIRLEHQRAGLAQPCVGHGRDVEGVGPAVVLDVHGEGVLARAEIGREVEQVVHRAPGLAARRPARDLLPVDIEHVARVRGQARGHARRHAGQAELLAEQPVRLAARPRSVAAEPHGRLDLVLGDPDPMAAPADVGKVLRCDWLHVGSLWDESRPSACG
ncbi:MAG: hypothetical protein BWY52_02482 [Chloroflexi bacterium ADurb.Bin325]|nr:MAG: hypothetical protein BWY52_02482 [Chloroflexi bacterium ADurb.Bin325]